jgi:4-hydroxy-tetrahydrodipicolinate reductase
MRQYRVVQIGAGNTGTHALRGIIDHPELELVGLGIRAAGKVGRDAGDLAGTDPVGVLATNDLDSLLALDPDCICFMAGDFTHGVGRSAAPLVQQMCKFLRAGIDMVSTTMSAYVHLSAIPEHYRDELECACREGGATFLTVGIDPGFMNDALVLLLSGFSHYIEKIRGQELLNYGTYFSDEALFDKLGFGRTPDEERSLHSAGRYARAWRGVVDQISDGIGVILDDVVDTREVWYTPVPLATERWHIEEGTVAAIRFEVLGVVADEPRIILEHITRLEKDAAPQWPNPPGHGGYRVQIEGVPSMTLEVALDDGDGDANIGALIATAMRAVNAIPLVCDAPPGLKSWFDFPHIIGRHAFRTAAPRRKVVN